MMRVLVAEDSETTRQLLVEILDADPELRVIGHARNGVEALEMTARLHPDVVTMDIRMPILDGFEATKQIMAEVPTPIVIVSASVNIRDVEISMHALRAGALAVMEKPVGPASPDFERQARELVATVKAMAAVKVVRRRIERGPRAPAAGTAKKPVGARRRVVAIAASTGGPAALQRLLLDLPRDFPLPVLVVQHMAGGFIPGFAAWLNRECGLRVKVAEDGETMVPGTVYVGAEGRHLGVGANLALRLSDDPEIEGFRPSATFLFESVGRAFGQGAIAVVLTGMGRDGMNGLRVIHDNGGVVLVQDESSSVVFGMPRAAVDAGFADLVVPLSGIGQRLTGLV